MPWLYRRGIGVTMPRHRAILSEASLAGVCCQTDWRPHVVSTILPTRSRFAAIIRALCGPCVKQQIFLRNSAIAAVQPGPLISKGTWRAPRATWLPLEDCINARFQPSGKRETLGAPHGL